MGGPERTVLEKALNNTDSPSEQDTHFVVSILPNESRRMCQSVASNEFKTSLKFANLPLQQREGFRISTSSERCVQLEFDNIAQISRHLF